MSIAAIIGQNIEKLREQQDISVESLATLIGVTRQTMTSYLKGKQVIDSGKLAVIAEYFNKPFDYFLTENHIEFSLMFRADNPKQNFDQVLAEKVIQKINNYCDLLSMSDRKLSLLLESYRIHHSGKKLTKEEKELIEEIAFKKREDFGIGDIVPDNIYDVLSDKGINILAFPFNNDSIFAISAYSQEHGCFITINDDDDIPEERKIFSAIHELGHLIFHKEQYSQKIDTFSFAYGKKKDINEEVANHFAMCFLVPGHLLKKFKNYFRNKDFVLKEVLEVKQNFQVSAKCLLYALRYYGYITKRQKGVHIGYLNKKGYATAEPKPMKVLKKDLHLINLVKNLYLHEEISTSKVCETLGLSMLQVRKLTKEWVAEIDTKAIF